MSLQSEVYQLRHSWQYVSVVCLFLRIVDSSHLKISATEQSTNIQFLFCYQTSFWDIINAWRRYKHFRDGSVSMTILVVGDRHFDKWRINGGCAQCCEQWLEKEYSWDQWRQEYQLEAFKVFFKQIWTRCFLLHDNPLAISVTGGQKVPCQTKCDGFGAPNLSPPDFSVSAAIKCPERTTIH
jgi:hypothetical protein